MSLLLLHGTIGWWIGGDTERERIRFIFLRNVLQLIFVSHHFQLFAVFPFARISLNSFWVVGGKSAHLIFRVLLKILCGATTHTHTVQMSLSPPRIELPTERISPVELSHWAAVIVIARDIVDFTTTRPI